MEKTVQEISVSERIRIELEKIPTWKLMMHLQGKGELPAYQIAKELGWSTGKVHSLIKKLEKSNAVKSNTRLVNNRAAKFVRLVE